MWLLIAAILCLPLILNLYLWRLDLGRVDRLKAQKKTPSLHLPAGPAPRVSFLVAAWNEGAALRPCIEAILGLRYSNLEIVLCAGGTDRTEQIASQFRDPRLVLLLQRSAEGKQESLRRCLERSTGSIVYLLDCGGRVTGAAVALLLDPILGGAEQVVTGRPCTPLPGQIDHPFAMSQCASQAYVSLHKPVYSSGLIGANSAILRSVLEEVGGFSGVVRTGVDYELGKRLLRRGIPIRYEVDATFPSEFHTRVRPYLHQQARWIRNVVLHGLRFGAWREAVSGILESLVGLTMLVLPLVSLLLAMRPGLPCDLGAIGGVLWAFGFLYAFFSRLRYLDVASRWLDIPFPWRAAAWSPCLLWIDFVAWAIPLFQYPSARLRERW